MKRIIVTLTTLLLAVGIGAISTSPAQANASAQARACRMLDWIDNEDPAPWMTWVSVSQAHYNGHFYTSNNCADTFRFWSAGVAFEPKACVEVRLIYYDSNHNFSRQTGWKNTNGCGGTIIPLTYQLPDNRVEFSFACRHVNPERRSRVSHCLYNLVIF